MAAHLLSYARTGPAELQLTEGVGHVNQPCVRLIVNPRSGHKPSERNLAAAIDWLEGRGWRVDRQDSGGPGHTQALAAEAADAAYDTVLACGGDGTINEVVNGLADTATALAVIPAGTANVWAKEVQIPSRPLDAVKLLVCGARRRVDLGRADGRYFLMLASAGTDSEAIRAVTVERKRRWGRFAYIAAGLSDLFQNGGRQMLIEADGEPIACRALLAIAANTRLYGGALLATPHARLDDGLLDLCVYKGTSWRHLPLHVLRTLRMRHDQGPGVIYRQVRHVRLGTTHPLAIEADGEHIGETPMTIEAVPAALTVVVPRGLRSPLFREQQDQA